MSKIFVFFKHQKQDFHPKNQEIEMKDEENKELKMKITWSVYQEKN